MTESPPTFSKPVRFICSFDWNGVDGVYFIAAAGSPAVKIGYSRDIGKRLKVLAQQSVLPLHVAGAISGTQTTERAVHRVYAHRRYHGEWFRYTAAMIEEFNLDYWCFDFQNDYWPRGAACGSIAPCNHGWLDKSVCVKECGRLLRKDSTNGELLWDSSERHWRCPESALEQIEWDERVAGVLK